MSDCDVAAVLRTLADEGLSLELRDGVPRVQGGRPTPWLMDDLRRCREAIIAHLAATVAADNSATVADCPVTLGNGCREWLWRGGRRYRGDGSEPDDWHPAGAWWWRYAGADRWQVIEERIAPPEPLPEELKTHLGVHTVAGFRAGFYLPPGA